VSQINLKISVYYLGMGFRGRTPPGQNLGGRISGALTGRGGAGLGAQSGTFRVSHDKTGRVTITKVPGKKRRKQGARIPQYVREQMRATTDLVRAVSFKVIASHTS